jgi:DNA recombination protein RmuC
MANAIASGDARREKRCYKAWQILGAVRSEFSKYNTVVTRLARQLDTAAKSVEALGVRTRAMDRKLGAVEKLPQVRRNA